MKAWAEISAGDVVKTRSGVLRVVRKVSRGNLRSHYIVNPERSIWCFFVIRSCSSTGRCYTLYNVAEMKQMGWVMTGIKAKMKTPLDEEVNSVIQEGTDDIGCCEVRGIA